MQINFYNTKELSENIFEEYSKSFNQVFKQKKNIDFFKKKYLNNSLKFSFHSFYIKNNKVIGACTVIPFEYDVFGTKSLLGLVVDTFILNEYRKEDPFLLLRMYKKLKNELIKNKIIATVSVPNVNAYEYWKKIVRCKDLLRLNYYVNLNNDFSIKLLYYINKFLFKNEIKSSKKIKIIRSKDFYSQRLFYDYKIFKNNNYQCVFTFHKEKNKKVAYLLDFFNLKSLNRDINSLIYSMNCLKDIDTDLVMFVGKIEFKQLFLFKVPSLFEPKKLDVIIDNFEKNQKELLNFHNWDFGLLNFDVR